MANNQSISGAAAHSVKTVCPYCGVGCGMILQVENNRVVKVTGDTEHPANFGRLCAKGNTVALTLNSSDRLTAAYVRNEKLSERVRVPLDLALKQTAERLQKIIAEHGPDAVALYVSGQLSMESQYLANKLAKGFLRTNNIDSNSRLCMASAASGYKLSLGADGPPGSYQDIDRLDCALVIGANMADCHPILFLRLLDRQKQGAKIIVVDPRRTTTAEKADLHLQIKPGTDLALLNGLLRLLLDNGHVDDNFIAQHTEGWEELRTLLNDYSPTRVAEITGLREKDICTAAKWIGESPELTTLWTMGLNQSTHGTWHTNAICNLHLATGKICRPGSGPFSLTGQPNAMGGREVGYMSHALPGQRVVTSEEDRTFIEKVWGLPEETIGDKPGLGAVSLFKKLEAGEVKAVWIIGTNPIASMPNRQRVINGLQRAELVIVQDAYHPTETSRYADILLPGALWAEAEGTMVNSERNITLMQPAVAPPGEARADWWILTQVARQLGFEKAFPYETASDVFDEIRQTWNSKTGYDLRGISYESLRQKSRQWPCAPDMHDGEAIRYLTPEKSVQFPAESGKGQFLARPFLPPAELPDKDFPFALNTGRLAHQWHTLTKTGKVPALNKLNPGPFVEIHPDDAKALGVHAGALVQVASRRGMAVYPAVVSTRVQPGNCFAPFHWNDQFGPNLAVNAATSEAVDAVSLQPEFKFCAVALTKAPAELEADFTPHQKIYLREFLADQPGSTASRFRLPAAAPFTQNQRIYINEALAKILAGK
ncbi:MAG TPA: nitrate reductase [Verrucomicrobiae bacterium]|nr:nitrate reductase [Verrucomicrobiae bacterium]